MNTKEIAAILQATQGASKTIQNALTAMLYEIEHVRKDAPIPITDEALNVMWTQALGRMIEGHATIVQAKHLLTLIEDYYGIKRQ